MMHETRPSYRQPFSLIIAPIPNYYILCYSLFKRMALGSFSSVKTREHPTRMPVSNLVVRPKERLKSMTL